MEVLTLPIRKTSTCATLPRLPASAALICPSSAGSTSSDLRSRGNASTVIGPCWRVVSSTLTSGCRRCGCEGAPRDTVTRRLAHEPLGWRPTTLLVTIRRYRCSGCGHVWRQDTSKAAQPRAKLSRRGLRWALEGIVVQHLTVARVAEGLGVAWRTADDAVLAEGRRVLIDDPNRFDGVQVVGVDEHVVRHEALLFRMEVRDRHRLAVVAVG